MDHHNQLSLHSRITHMFVNCKVNLSIVGILQPYSPASSLTGHGFKILSQNNFRANISTRNDSVGISYKLSYKQQAKVQILTSLSSKGYYLDLIYFRNLPKI